MHIIVAFILWIINPNTHIFVKETDTHSSLELEPYRANAVTLIHLSRIWFKEQIATFLNAV